MKTMIVISSFGIANAVTAVAADHDGFCAVFGDEGQWDDSVEWVGRDVRNKHV